MNKIIAVLLALFCVFTSVLKGVGDPDAFWHFLLGLTAGAAGILFFGIKDYDNDQI